MMNSYSELKKSSLFNPNSPSIEKKEITSSMYKNENNFKKRIIFKNRNNNSLSNKDLNTISLTTNYKLKTNYSQNYIDIPIQKTKNEINIINNSSSNIESNNNRNLFKNTYNNKIKIRKINLSKNYNRKNIYNNTHNLSKSMNNIDSKTLELALSKLRYNSINEINNRINKILNNESIRNESLIKNKSCKILLPKLINSKKKIKKNKMSFLMKSKHKKISANDIYLHYLKENENDKNKSLTLYNFTKYLKDNNNKKFNYGLDKIYGNNQSFISRMNEIKKNNNIAMKNDFNIQDYQKTLLKLLKEQVSEKNLDSLETSYKIFNERNFGMLIPRGRYIDLANKLKDFLSKDIFEKMKRLDKNYVIFLEKKEELKHRNSLEFENKNKFYTNLNKTIVSFNRKRNKKNTSI